MELYESYMLSMGMAKDELASSHTSDEVSNVMGELMNQIVVDPAEERLKSEFAGVKRSYIPMHAIVRIDEVEKEGSVRIRDAKSSDGKVMTLPLPGLRPQFGAGSSEPPGDG